MKFRERATVGVIDDRAVLLLAFPASHACPERWVRGFGVDFQSQQAETVRQFLHRLETLAQKPFGVAHKMELGGARYGDQPRLSLCPGIVDGGLQQGLSVPASFVLP